jgi:hypothetical protein
MSFWQADTKLAIGQKSVAIPAEVQGEYTENNKIIIKVDPSTEFLQRECGQSVAGPLEARTGAISADSSRVLVLLLPLVQIIGAQV